MEEKNCRRELIYAIKREKGRKEGGLMEAEDCDEERRVWKN